jgi:ParB-like chromosome segregation protein Spo0J
MAALEIHPICEAFPRMSDDELRKLADDIAAHGLREPIWTYRGAVIDGGNRTRACEIAGVEPTTREWDGDGSLVAFVLSLNLHRRHLTAGQRAALAAELKPFVEAEIAEETRKKSSEGGKTAGSGRPKADAGDKGFGKNSEPLIPAKPGRDARAEVAKEAKVNPRYVSDVERIREASPETAEAIKRGEKTIPKAKEELGIGKPKANGKPRDTTPTGFVAIDVHEPEETTRVGDVAEEIDEREAMGDDALSDEDWLRSLPLSARLEGRPLTIFRADALAYRLLEKPRRSYKHHADRAFRAVRNNRGAFIWRAKSFLGIDHPRKWVRCAAPEHGGCGGTGEVKGIGACPECRGRGYRINNG